MEHQAVPARTAEFNGKKAERGPRDPKTGVRVSYTEQQATPPWVVEAYGQKAERGPRDPKTGVRDPLPPRPLGLKGPSVAKYTTEEYLAFVLEWGKQWEQNDEVMSKGNLNRMTKEIREFADKTKTLGQNKETDERAKSLQEHMFLQWEIFRCPRPRVPLKSKSRDPRLARGIEKMRTETKRKVTQEEQSEWEGLVQHLK